MLIGSSGEDYDCDGGNDDSDVLSRRIALHIAIKWWMILLMNNSRYDLIWNYYICDRIQISADLTNCYHHQYHQLYHHKQHQTLT